MLCNDPLFKSGEPGPADISLFDPDEEEALVGTDDLAVGKLVDAVALCNLRADSLVDARLLYQLTPRGLFKGLVALETTAGRRPEDLQLT